MDVVGLMLLYATVCCCMLSDGSLSLSFPLCLPLLVAFPSSLSPTPSSLPAPLPPSCHPPCPSMVVCKFLCPVVMIELVHEEHSPSPSSPSPLLPPSPSLPLLPLPSPPPPPLLALRLSLFLLLSPAPLSPHHPPFSSFRPQPPLPCPSLVLMDVAVGMDGCCSGFAVVVGVDACWCVWIL